MIPDRLARNPVNHAYERGWAEGWAAALAAVERRGLEAVLAGEQRLRPVPLTLAFEPQATETDRSRSEDDGRTSAL